MSTDTTQEHSCEAQAAPGEEHRRFDTFIGQWNARATFWMSPDQEPMTTEGQMVNTWALGKRYLEMRYKSEFMGQPFEGIGYWGYNTASGLFESFWIDTAGTMMMFDCDGTVSADGKVFRSSGTVINPQTRQPMRKSVVTTIKNENEHTYAMSFGDEGQEMKVMEIVYTRA
jgi:Protein of unknown function (DUF1579)